MLKELKYISVSIIQSVRHDFLEGYDNMARPKELLKIIFWIILLMLLLGKYVLFNVFIGLYVLVYIWKIVQQGNWKRMMREENLKKLKNK